MNNRTVKVKTTPYDDGMIEQFVKFPGVTESHAATVYKWVIDTQEKQVRDALIQLGWTPPKEDKCQDAG